MRYFFHIGYNGANYRGWQKFPQIKSVQHTLETSISKILKMSITIVGCGRTDALVHAAQFFFHLDVDAELDSTMLFRLNKNLPDDIAVFDILLMDGLPHARFDAVRRTYDYFIHTYKDPFLSSISSLYPEKNLDLDKMKEAASLLTRYNDFRAFCKNAAMHRTTRCEVTAANLFVDTKGDRLRFTISANRFLRGMVRITMQKLLQVGNGKMSIDEFEHYLISKEPPSILKPAYPQGLHLSKITYPFLDIPPRSEFLNMQVNQASIWQLV